MQTRIAREEEQKIASDDDGLRGQVASWVIDDRDTGVVKLAVSGGSFCSLPLTALPADNNLPYQTLSASCAHHLMLCPSTARQSTRYTTSDWIAARSTTAAAKVSNGYQNAMFHIQVVHYWNLRG